MTNDFQYKPTTAFWKIDKLLRTKSKEYIIQGGQGAGKTISILMLLIDYAHSNDVREISILSDELSKMKKTIIRDFLKIVKDWNLYRKEYWNKTESIYTFPNGSFIEFVGLDVSDIGKGMRRHISYFNEVNKVNEEGYSQVASRSNKVLMDFNPDAHFFAHELINDTNFLSLTFNDNEYLSQSEVDSILEYKRKGYNEEGTIINQFWANKWRVYGLGEIGSVEGRIYEHFRKVSYMDFIKLNLPTFYGMDWGKNHPFAVLQFKYDKYNNSMYCHELNYDSEVKLLSKLTDREKALIGDKHGGIIPYLAEKLGIPKDATIVCDSAVPDNILLLRSYGYEYAYGIDKPRGSVMAGITLVQSKNIFYTDCSTNIHFESFNYSYRKDRKGVIDDEVDKINDDAMDVIRYGVRHAEKQL